MSSFVHILWTLSPEKVVRKIQNFFRYRSVEEVITVTSGPGADLRIWLPTSKGSYGDMKAGTYEMDILERLQDRFSFGGKVVWDVGAHIGYISLICARWVGSKGAVIAFEPSSTNVETLRKNIELNPLLPPIKIRNVALAATKGQGTMYLSNADAGPATLGGFLEQIQPPLTETAYKDFDIQLVETSTLDEEAAHLPTPHLIKIDAEGAEYEILKGGVSLLRQHKPILLIEIHTIPAMMRTAELLRAEGYAFEMLDEYGKMQTKNILAFPL